MIDEFTKKRIEDWWPCACMKRRGGKLTHIKLNAPEKAACKKCGCTKADNDKFRAEGRS
jgi:hypothetical protein